MKETKIGVSVLVYFSYLSNNAQIGILSHYMNQFLLKKVEYITVEKKHYLPSHISQAHSNKNFFAVNGKLRAPKEKRFNFFKVDNQLSQTVLQNLIKSFN